MKIQRKKKIVTKSRKKRLDNKLSLCLVQVIIGPNNPKDYRGRDSYQYQPTWSPTEMAAYRHDLWYDALGASGVGGAFSPRTKGADLHLIYECRQVLKNPNSSAQERSRARKNIAGFSSVNFIKPSAPR